MNVTRQWKRVLAVGCSHGIYADPLAIDAVLRFKESFKPHTTIHLGDFCDCSAFMASKVAHGDGEPIRPDVDGGLSFIRALRPNHILLGNHEDRLERLAESRNELIAYAAAEVLADIRDTAAKLKATVLPYTGNEQDLRIADIRFMHGTVFGENATRDHAESFAPVGGKVVHAHSHRAGMAPARRGDGALGFNVGTLTARGALEYAKTRRATLSWSQGFVWGEYTDTTSQLFLCLKQGTWRLPL